MNTRLKVFFLSVALTFFIYNLAWQDDAVEDSGIKEVSFETKVSLLAEKQAENIIVSGKAPKPASGTGTGFNDHGYASRRSKGQCS